MEFSLFDISTLLIAFASLLLAGFLLTLKSKNYLSNMLIALFLIVNAIDWGTVFLNQFIFKNLPVTGMIVQTTVFLKAPLLYLYILSVIYSNFRFKPKYLLHFIPFLIFSLILIPWNSMFQQNETEVSSVNDFTDAATTIKFLRFSLQLQILVYLIASFLAVRKYREILLENYSNAGIFNYKWLFQLISIFAVIFILSSIRNVFQFLDLSEIYRYLLLVSSFLGLGFICWLILKALQAPELFRGINSDLQLVNKQVKETKRLVKSEEPNTTKRVINLELKTKLEQYMTEKKPWLDASLSIYDLSRQLNVPFREISIYINHDLNKHFFDFVNGYRIEKAKQMLTDPDKKDFTVLEILYDVGFNSKSSFNTAFKKHTGYTPTQYRKKQL